ncbi:alkaline shock response membrane anchor protein AmaP [Enterococcus pingfangensis]|uniref:alkaline shock response membrane anchor protein AmaP n=1 Tax=Enterococcus pingfangensis TaxID=2559924 RepID=UPI0010F55CF1|nr:alkaline shock response membrane anchor protein AmaP [Enterococcus pingfangensis]
MNRFLKIILVIFSLVLLSIFLSVAAIYYFIAENPVNISSSQHVLTNNYVQLYLFWVSVILAALTVITIFMLLFYPKRIIKFTLKEERGQATLDKQAKITGKFAANPTSRTKNTLAEQNKRSDDSETEQRIQ